MGIRYEYYDQDEGGGLKAAVHALGNRFHRTGNLPAATYYHPNGTVSKEMWCIYGNLHRIHGPALKRYNDSGMLIIVKWYKHDLVHRDGDLPAVIHYKATKALYSHWDRGVMTKKFYSVDY